jgi:protein-S-isoprenylcysteine O-methyltransferase Ste14
MHDDQTFRLVLIAGYLLLIPVGLYHRIRSQATGERLDRRQEGLFILIALRLVGLVRAAGLIAYLINPAWMAWSAVPLPAWLRWLGVGLGAAGGLLITWTFHTLGRNITDTVVTRKEHTLVTTGPYRWVRHPFYVALALLLLADSLMTANGFLLATGALVLLLLLRRTRIEEAKLIERFGSAYQAYMRRTGRFWPRPGRTPATES